MAFFFFFQAEDGIRDADVTGVQTCALPILVTTRRHGMRCRMRTAMTRDGRLLGRDVECWFDTGAYADNGPRVTATGGDAAPGPYRWESFRVDARCVYTNTAPSGSYRAFGATHLQWIGESQVDEIARRCGIDPLELRRQNLCLPGEEIRLGGKPLDADLVGDVEKAAAAVGWGEPKPPHVGRGVSVGLLAAGAHPVSAAEISVEPETGIVTVLRSATVADVGRAINPQLVERQDEGATMQGIGNALYEEMIFEDGFLMNDTMLDYRVPTFEDMPGKMTSIVVENGDGPGPFGAKGCGEGALAAVPAAIVNALADAGVPMTTLPLTPERVWRRIQEVQIS